ncbi:MAG: hypothetical protein CMQ20_18200 [Gammaproteobacteria bacterium]|nr:hypothetical protein [Gammaproteobacteria bacterium]
MVIVAGDQTDVFAIAIATIQGRHATQPAIDHPPATAGTEHDPAIGQIGRLDVVVLSGSKLLQAGSVDVDLVEMVGGRFPLAIREEDLLAIVMDLGIANAAVGIVQQHLELAGTQIQSAQAPALAKTHAGRVVAIVAEVDVPMILSRNAGGKDDLVDLGHRAVEHGLQEFARSVLQPGGTNRRRMERQEGEQDEHDR